MQSTSEHIHSEHGQDGHGHTMQVNDNLVTAFLGIVIALGMAWGLVSVSSTMTWHQSVGGVLVGLSGVVIGALGSCVERPNAAAILGWAGATNFFLGLILFFTLMSKSMG